MILLIDNYDSFTYNLYQLVGTLQPDVKVVRNDALTVADIRQMAPTHLILSPGPGRPEDAGICEEALRELKGELPILGVCLGHQALGEVFGGRVIRAPQLVHGKQSQVHIANGSALFQGLAPIIPAARYHSLLVEKATLPDELLVIAETDQGEIMGLKHRDYNLYGLQFHPESILTPDGKQIIQNFLQIEGGK
ncbi:aminodeoxychorismate/anthranilate synthase component II [Acidaminococcus sp. NSJ-142]|jgi:anthranilate synthase component 2|uniref:anthranilate synthase component II n=1 Tax=Acidaminococcus TaxID=904 RepID=UPI000CFA2C46|nr:MULTISPECIES: aminodeoxychorismate/anthranilate synthase component II [Acidaminococcus]MCD2436193.1 aminodeoxychorismate/anthranilate synthase component II [Acidaminococcus hominis]MCH4097040.1 aminodeoxychorismate/anthranilate synthase component II [Acidaminococcus provencensis]RHK01702.1 aminodeoxychorismate/anthranilate synthase component II [Acidaminococcus sp. AM05-11]